MRRYTAYLPDRLMTLLKTGRRVAKRHASKVLYFGRARFCPVCRKHSRRFRPYGITQRADAQCVHCGALERHRLFWHYALTKTDLFDGKPKKMLHIAPEACFEPRLKSLLGGSYLTADLVSPKAMVKMDITDIDYPQFSFDVVYCSHVLEHIPDDRKAMRELLRVLKTSGWAILLVPVFVEKTIEDPSITDPLARLQKFGNPGHFRIYGPDYADRLRDEGFCVSVCTIRDLVSPEEAVRFGFTSAAGEIYYCTKS